MRRKGGALEYLDIGIEAWWLREQLERVGAYDPTGDTLAVEICAFCYEAWPLIEEQAAEVLGLTFAQVRDCAEWWAEMVGEPDEEGWRECLRQPRSARGNRSARSARQNP